MSSNIEQGLDAIIQSGGISSGGSISSGGKNRRKGNNRGGVKKASGGSNTKTLGKALAAASKTNKKQKAKANSNGATAAAAAAAAAAALDPLANAKRVVVSNLPRDVDEPAVRKFFQDSIGRIRNIKGTYNANGSPTGTYTITFEKPGSAKKVLEKFNNEPIDGGKARLSVQILIDATAVPPKPLADRIGVKADASASNNTKSKANKRKGGAKNADGPVKAVQKAANDSNSKSAKSKKTAKKQNAKKPAPRTAADLDAEMSDYFASADRNEISV